MWLLAFLSKILAGACPNDVGEDRVVSCGILIHLGNTQNLAVVVKLVSDVADKLGALLASLQAGRHETMVPFDLALGGAVQVDGEPDLQEHGNVVVDVYERPQAGVDLPNQADVFNNLKNVVVADKVVDSRTRAVRSIVCVAHAGVRVDRGELVVAELVMDVAAELGLVLGVVASNRVVDVVTTCSATEALVEVSEE